jgi:hypothetical protein
MVIPIPIFTFTMIGLTDILERLSTTTPVTRKGPTVCCGLAAAVLPPMLTFCLLELLGTVAACLMALTTSSGWLETAMAIAMVPGQAAALTTLKCLSGLMATLTPKIVVVSALF